MRRLDFILTAFDNAVLKMKPDHIAIEGYSYGSGGRASVDMGELGGCLRRSMWSVGHSYAEVPPKTLKLWVATNGNAKKEDMKLHCYKRWQFEAATNDEVDAYCLARIAVGMELKNTQVVQKLRGKCKWVEGRG